MDRKIKAYDYFREGYNCAQSVVMTFADVLDMDECVLMAIAAPFGAGFARTRNLCGTVSGIGMVLGLMKHFSGDIGEDKKDIYKEVRMLTDQFEEKNGTLICGELLKNVKNITTDYVPAERTAEYYKTRPCVKFVMDAVELIENSDIFKEYMASRA